VALFVQLMLLLQIAEQPMRSDGIHLLSLHLAIVLSVSYSDQFTLCNTVLIRPLPEAASPYISSSGCVKKIFLPLPTSSLASDTVAQKRAHTVSPKRDP